MARGFTIIEVVITIVLLGILAAALLPRTPIREAVTILGRAEQLASDIRYAQTLSMTTGARHCLALDPAAGPPYSGYRLTNGAACNTTVVHPAGLTQPISLCSSGTCFTATSLPNDYVQFDGLGVPYAVAGSATALAANAVITISDAGGTKNITISHTTGRVVVQ